MGAKAMVIVAARMMRVHQNAAIITSKYARMTTVNASIKTLNVKGLLRILRNLARVAMKDLT